MEYATARRPAGMAAMYSGGRKIRPKSRNNRAQSFTALSKLDVTHRHDVSVP